ncbi:MAG: hypothetical protein ACYC1Q_00300 [Bacteroidia bacterium]
MDITLISSPLHPLTGHTIMLIVNPKPSKTSLSPHLLIASSAYR